MNSFVNRYIDEHGQNVECITKFFAYNQELVKKDREKIFAYLIDTYGLNQEKITVDKFLTDKYGNVINELNTIDDLDDLEKTIGLAILSGLIIDDFRLRFIFLNQIGNNHIFLDRDKFDFTSKENTYLYFSGLKKHIIKNQVFLVNMEIINSYKQMKERKSTLVKENIYTTTELKNSLFNWLIDTKRLTVTDEIKEVYNFLLNHRLSDMINFIIYLIQNNLPADYVLMCFYRDSSLNILDEVSRRINDLNDADKNAYEDYRANIINEIIEKYNHQNKRK